MKLTVKIKKAIDLASELFVGQIRKGNDVPAVSHSFSVAWILSNYTEDEDIIVAGLLHDVLGDVKGYYFSDLERDFGSRVAKIVSGVSENKDPNIEEDAKKTWRERKEKYLDNLRSQDEATLMVCAADKIHNLQSIVEGYKKHGEKLWEKFNSPSDKRLWVYKEAVDILKERLNNPIADDLGGIYSKIVLDLEGEYFETEKILLNKQKLR